MEERRVEHVELEGDRILLRPVRPADAERAFELVRENRKILDWLVWPGPGTAAELAAYYGVWSRHEEGCCDLKLALVEKESELFVGAISVRFIGHPGRGDLGYWLSSDHWGRGYMTEAVGLVTDLSFRHLEADLIYAQVFAGNVGSRRALERNGLAEDHVSQARLRGEVRDQWHLSITRRTYLRERADSRPVREIVRFE